MPDPLEYNFWWPWVTPNPGFKVTGYLKVEYLADGARVFNCTKHSCRSLGVLPKTCKKLGVVAEIFFFAKSAGRCFTPLMEIKHNRVNLRWNFYADIQLIRGRFWLQLWMVKKFGESSISWKYLAKMCKNSKMLCGFAVTVPRWADRKLYAFNSTACRRLHAGGVGGKANRLLGVANS